MSLIGTSTEILKILEKQRKKLKLTFEESTHTYTMLNEKKELRSDYPSVSKVIKYFYEEFDSEGISYRKAQGDLEKQKQLLAEWKGASDYATNMGSRAHYILEKKSIELFKLNKEVRKPIYECDESQMIKSNSMIAAGLNYLSLMQQRGAHLLDTETVLGDIELGYTGQPDKIWLLNNKDTSEIGFFITDWKTNQPKNFEVNNFTKKMYSPFDDIDDTALGHYYLQLPLYAKLFKRMLKGSKYENINFLGAIIVLLKDDSSYEEYRVPKKVINTIMNMNVKEYFKI
jgi:hypothetical protein